MGVGCVPVVPANLEPLFITSFLTHPLATQGAHTCFHLLNVQAPPLHANSMFRPLAARCHPTFAESDECSSPCVQPSSPGVRLFVLSDLSCFDGVEASSPRLRPYHGLMTQLWDCPFRPPAQPNHVFS